MMNGAHMSTGMLTGVALAVVVSPAPPPTALALAALVGGGAALLPDIDHDQSTITRSAGPITRVLAEALQALARVVYRATVLPHDPPPRDKRGEHRGLIHTPAFALLLGALIAGGTWASPWVGIGVTYALTSAAVRSLRWSLPQPVRSGLRLHWPIMPPLLAAAITYGLVQAGAVEQAGPWLGALVSLGMIMHSLGDGATNTGIPFLWWFRRRCDRCKAKDKAAAAQGKPTRASCPGARWDRQNVLPEILRWSAGAKREKAIEIACLIGAAALALRFGDWSVQPLAAAWS